jgi:transcriptional regulator with XRE-family HTH domain
MNDADAVREFLVAHRRALGRTQASVAKAMKTGQSALSDLEQGVNANPTVDTLARWAWALGFDLALDCVPRFSRCPSCHVSLPHGPVGVHVPVLHDTDAMLWQCDECGHRWNRFASSSPHHARVAQYLQMTYNPPQPG